jgi:hypothetical protein
MFCLSSFRSRGLPEPPARGTSARLTQNSPIEMRRHVSLARYPWPPLKLAHVIIRSMTRRWFVRGVLIALCTLCALAWVGSYFQMVGLQRSSPGRVLLIGIDCGSALIFSSVDLAPPRASLWYVYHEPAYFERARRNYRNMDYHFVGFAFQQVPGAPPDYFVFVPLWFPTTLSALLLWFGWRKTRARPSGFPLEAGKETPPPPPKLETRNDGEAGAPSASGDAARSSAAKQ